MRWDVSKLDVVFISYDEPQADELFQSFSESYGHRVQRVHGISGIHRAYARAAALVDTDRFVTVDGDNFVFSGLLQNLHLDDGDAADAVLSLAAVNPVNGLSYGNGGIKIWPRWLLDAAPTHEQSNSQTVDFIQVYRYLMFDVVASECRFNQSPLHAFRAAYREAIKLTLTAGTRKWNEVQSSISKRNWSRLLVWMCVGANAVNGVHTLLGARYGVIDFWERGLATLESLNDYDWLNDRWVNLQYDRDVGLALETTSTILDRMGIPCVTLGSKYNDFFRQAYLNPPRCGFVDEGVPATIRT